MLYPEQDNATNCVYVVGDMNADVADRNSLFMNHLTHFCEDNNFVLSSKVLLPIDSYTYISEAWHTTSWLDHCISTADGHEAIESMNIKYGVSVTGHITLAFTINVEELPSTVSNSACNATTSKLDWSMLTREHVLEYYNNTHIFLRNIHMPKEAFMCKDVNCMSEQHNKDLCAMYDDVVAALNNGSKPFCKLNKHGRKYNIRPGWHEHVAPYHAEAREAHKLWAMAGRPWQGPELEYKKLANARFKYAVRFISKNEQAMQADSLAYKMLSNNMNDFWKEVRALHNCKSSLPCTVDGISGTDNIAELWRQHYSLLFNCVKSDPYKGGSVRSGDLISITTQEIKDAIHDLPNNKACGMDLISAEHLKNASLRLAPLLALCFSGFMIHGTLPDSIISILLVPVIKDKAGKVGCLDNYRPIALASILSKVMEKIPLDRINRYIISCDNQQLILRGHFLDVFLDFCCFILDRGLDAH